MSYAYEWMHLETLKTFCDVIETGSLSAAAKLNRVTQSAVSQQLRMLEQRYGQQLVERSPRAGARAAPAGQLLYDELKPLLERFAALERRVRERRGVIAGSLRVATVYSVGLHTLPPAIKKFLRAHPAVRLRLEYLRTDQVYDACVTGKADLGIVAVPARRAQLDVALLRPEEMVLVAPLEHRLARRPKLALADLAGQAFIAFDRDIPTRKLVDAFLRRHGVAVSYAMELDNIETIKRSVEAGLGVSILPRAALANEVRARTLRVRALPSGPLLRDSGVIYRRRRELSPAGHAFLGLLKRELGRD